MTTGFNAVKGGVMTAVNFMQNDFGPDTLAILKGVGKVATSAINIVAKPVMGVVGPMLSPILHMIPGEQAWADSVGNDIPILGNILGNVPRIPDPTPPPQECKINGTSNHAPHFKQAELDGIRASMANGMTAFRRELTRSSFCGLSDLNDAEAASINADFDEVAKHVIVPPVGCMSDDDKAYYLYLFCSMPEDGRKGVLGYLGIFLNATQEEVNLLGAQDYTLTQGQTPDSCSNPPPAPPMTIQQTMNSINPCSVQGGGSGQFTKEQLTTFKDQFNAGVSPFRALMIRTQICFMGGLSDSEATYLNGVISTVKTVHPPSGCMLDTEKPIFDNMLASECMTMRTLFVNLLSNFPNSINDEIKHFKATIDGLGCQQPSGCPAPTTVCRNVPPKVQPQAAVFDDSVLQNCTINGGGPGMFTPDMVANYASQLPMGMSPFKLMMTRFQLCQLPSLSDSEATSLTKDMNAYKTVTPPGTAMSSNEVVDFDLNILPTYCVDGRITFVNILAAWPTVNKQEISHFKGVVKALGIQQPST
ncbi:hypothetical protein FRB94_008643 [Tulasnella sp. JGI-2019a]|nr:hypothetical protein FRB94_008643 [Tulasnella sp. JGI-2019a]